MPSADEDVGAPGKLPPTILVLPAPFLCLGHKTGWARPRSVRPQRHSRA